MLCVRLCTSITNRIHIEASVTEKNLHFITWHLVCRVHHVTCNSRVLLYLDGLPLSSTICVPGESTFMVVHSFPVQPLRKDSSKASTHIWMTQRLEAGVREIVGRGFIPVFSCAWTVPVGMQLTQLRPPPRKKPQHKNTHYKSDHGWIFSEIRRLLTFWGFQLVQAFQMKYSAPTSTMGLKTNYVSWSLWYKAQSLPALPFLSAKCFTEKLLY